MQSKINMNVRFSNIQHDILSIFFKELHVIRSTTVIQVHILSISHLYYLPKSHGVVGKVYLFTSNNPMR